MTNETKGMVLGLCGVAAFALTLPFTRSITPVFDPLFIAFGRAFLAALLAGSWLKLSRQPIPNKSQWLSIALVAAGVVFGFPVFSAIAMQSVPAAHGGVVLGLLPLATAVFGALIYRERPSVGFWVFCLLGSVLVIVYSLLKGGGQLQWGHIALLLAVVSTAASYAIGADLSKQLGGLQVISWALVFSLPVLMVPTIVYFPVALNSIAVGDWLAFLYLALVSQWLGFLFWNKGLAIGGIARVSQTQLLQPFITIIAATVITAEKLELQTLLFAAAVIISVAAGRRFKAS